MNTNTKQIAKQDIELGIDGTVMLKTTYVDGSVEYTFEFDDVRFEKVVSST